jgi:hypothetical protein
MEYAMRLSYLLFRILLLLYPSDLRYEFGQEMTDVFCQEIGDACRVAGWRGYLEVWVRTGVEILVVAMPSHLRLLGVSMVSVLGSAGFFLVLFRLLTIHLR